MCTITLEYNSSNALARRKLAALLSTGLFSLKATSIDEPSPEEVKAHKREVEEFLYGSRILAAQAFAGKL